MKSNTKHINNVLENKPELLFIIQTLSDKNNTDNNLINKFNNEEFIRLIKHHRLDSIFYKAIQEKNIELPTELQTKLEQINKRNKMRMMKLTAELIRIHKLFTENNIDYISLKGPALSQQIYRDYTIRSSRDLDILVREEDFVKASNLLKSINYINNKKYNTLNKFNYKEFKFHNTENKFLVELHHRLFNNKYLLPIKNQVIKKNIFVKINNVNIPVLPSKLNFEYIATHAAAHNWMRMVWAIDVLLLKDRVNNIDKKLTLINKTNDYNLEDYILENNEKQLILLGRMQHLLKLKNDNKYRFQEILQRLFIPYRYFDGIL